MRKKVSPETEEKKEYKDEALNISFASNGGGPADLLLSRKSDGKKLLKMKGGRMRAPPGMRPRYRCRSVRRATALVRHSWRRRSVCARIFPGDAGTPPLRPAAAYPPRVVKPHRTPQPIHNRSHSRRHSRSRTPAFPPRCTAPPTLGGPGQRRLLLSSRHMPTAPQGSHDPPHRPRPTARRRYWLLHFFVMMVLVIGAAFVWNIVELQAERDLALAHYQARAKIIAYLEVRPAQDSAR